MLPGLMAAALLVGGMLSCSLVNAPEAPADPTGSAGAGGTGTGTNAGGGGSVPVGGGGSVPVGGGGSVPVGGGGSGPCAEQPDGTRCGDPTEPNCDISACEAGQCIEAHAPVTTPCGSETQTECDEPDSCDGFGSCLPNFVSAGTSCGSPASTECTSPDSCDGAGTCDPNHQSAGTPCGSAASTACTSPDSCDGAGTCDPNHQSAGTPCGSPQSSDCDDPDGCDGAGQCLPNHAPNGSACSDCPAPPACATCLNGVCPNACSAATLTTTFAGGNGQQGNMFDVHALTAVIIESFSGNLNAGTQTMEIYYRVGTWVGHDISPGSWTLLGSASVSSVGTGSATPIPIAVNLPMSAGQIYAFYVTSTSSGVDYTNGSAVGNVAAQNSSLRILEGAGKSYPFGDTYTPRIWNGTVHYQACP